MKMKALHRIKRHLIPGSLLRLSTVSGDTRCEGRREASSSSRVQGKQRILDEITYALTPLLILLPLTANTAELAAIWIQGQALFYDLRDLDSLSHRERIRILEQTADCIQQAHDRRAFR
jgi:hypothetical protein